MDLIKGIDVSHWQGKIDWIAVKNSRYKFAFVKLTQGQSSVDSMGIINIRNAKNAGLIVGAYHYAKFTTVSEALAEANHFISKAQGLGLNYAILDIEDSSIRGDITAASIAFLDAVSKIGQPILYSGPYFIKTHFNPDITKYPLWVAHYGVQSPTIPLWKDWAIWQYTSTGSVPGISDNVDINVMKADFMIEKEEPKVKNLVVYGKKEDKAAAEMLAYRLKCPVMDADIPFDYSTVENVYCVGGPGQLPFTSYAKAIIAGADREDTMKKVLEFKVS